MKRRRGSRCLVSALFFLWQFLQFSVDCISLPPPPQVHVQIPFPRVSWAKAKLQLDKKSGLKFVKMQSSNESDVSQKIVDSSSPSSSSSSSSSSEADDGGEYDGSETDDSSILEGSFGDGSCSQTKRVEAKASDLYRVLCDLENYKAWGGTGIYGTRVIEVSDPNVYPRNTLTELKCGAFGFSFTMNVMSYFLLPQRMNSTTTTPYVVTFKLLQKVPFVDEFEGRYSLVPFIESNTNTTATLDTPSSSFTSSTTTTTTTTTTSQQKKTINTPSQASLSSAHDTSATMLTFESTVKFSGPIPKFIQKGLKNLVNDIAVKELKKYAEGGDESRMAADFLTRPAVEWSGGNSRRKRRFTNRFGNGVDRGLNSFLNWKSIHYMTPKNVLLFMHSSLYKVSTDIRQAALNSLNITESLIPKQIQIIKSDDAAPRSLHQNILLFLLVQNVFLMFLKPAEIFLMDKRREKPSIAQTYGSLLEMAHGGQITNFELDDNDSVVSDEVNGNDDNIDNIHQRIVEHKKLPVDLLENGAVSGGDIIAAATSNDVQYQLGASLNDKT